MPNTPERYGYRDDRERDWERRERSPESRQLYRGRGEEPREGGWRSRERFDEDEYGHGHSQGKGPRFGERDYFREGGPSFGHEPGRSPDPDESWYGREWSSRDLHQGRWSGAGEPGWRGGGRDEWRGGGGDEWRGGEGRRWASRPRDEGRERYGAGFAEQRSHDYGRGGEEREMSRRDEAHEPWMTDAAGFGRERQDRGYAGRGPRGYTRSDDRLREDICERLSAHPLIDASEIEVNVANGEVTLEGTVESRRVRHMAEDVCDSVMGVRDIHNNLRVNRQMRRDPESPTGRPPITHTEH